MQTKLDTALAGVQAFAAAINQAVGRPETDAYGKEVCFVLGQAVSLQRQGKSLTRKKAMALVGVPSFGNAIKGIRRINMAIAGGLLIEKPDRVDKRRRNLLATGLLLQIAENIEKQLEAAP